MKRVCVRRKKGLSPIIATVLLILLVMSLASIVFLWARGFIGEQIEKFGRPMEDQCKLIDFDVDLIKSGVGDALEIVNHGNIPIHSLEIKKFLGGNSEVGKFEFNIDKGGTARGDVLLRMKDGSLPKTITIYPVLVGSVVGRESNKIFTCMELGKKITI